MSFRYSKNVTVSNLSWNLNNCLRLSVIAPYATMILCDPMYGAVTRTRTGDQYFDPDVLSRVKNASSCSIMTHPSFFRSKIISLIRYYQLRIAFFISLRICTLVILLGERSY